MLEALIAGVNIVELDPKDTSVGYGGLPNADGVVQLDSCCMHGPKKRAGGVAALEGVRTPSKVATPCCRTPITTSWSALARSGSPGRWGSPSKRTSTPRRRVVCGWSGSGASIPEHFLDPEKRAQAGFDAGWSMVRDGLIDRAHYFGTINCDGVNAKGEVCGVTTTSGLAWKIPGRVGDSPILGAGLYVDGDVGAAGSTGRGEANLYGLCSFLIVEQLRQGKAPKDAGMEALRRVKANTIEKRLLDPNGNPKFGLNFYVVKQGASSPVSRCTRASTPSAPRTARRRKTEPLIDAKAP